MLPTSSYSARVETEPTDCIFAFQSSALILTSSTVARVMVVVVSSYLGLYLQVGNDGAFAGPCSANCAFVRRLLRICVSPMAQLHPVPASRRGRTT